MKTYYPTGEAELSPIAQELAQKLATPRETYAQVITLSGELGSGKTSFVKTFAEIMGITTPITSPTFTLINSYPLTDIAYERLYHLDLYRLSHHSETQELGLSELLKNPQFLILMEWPERVEEILNSTPHTRLYFYHRSPDQRQIDIVYNTESYV